MYIYIYIYSSITYHLPIIMTCYLLSTSSGLPTTYLVPTAYRLTTYLLPACYLPFTCLLPAVYPPIT